MDLKRLFGRYRTEKCPSCKLEVDIDIIPTSGFPPRQRKYCPRCGRVMVWVSEPYPTQEQLATQRFLLEQSSFPSLFNKQTPQQHLFQSQYAQ